MLLGNLPMTDLVVLPTKQSDGEGHHIPSGENRGDVGPHELQGKDEVGQRSGQGSASNK